jgi:hypothetical protein
MRAFEFLTESDLSLMDQVKYTLPNSYVIPGLKNNDFYMQYRFGVALAGSKGKEQRDKDQIISYEKESLWNENEFVSSFDENVDVHIDDALNQIGMKGKKAVSTKKSQEVIDVKKTSPLKPFKGYKRK